MDIHNYNQAMIRTKFIQSYCEAVRLFPNAYKQCVKENPHAHALVIIAGLSEDEIARLTREQIEETKMLERA